MGWNETPQLVGEHLHRFEHAGDLNERRLRDAEVLGAACCNTAPKIILEIGTGEGYCTAQLATNGPDATVYTVNIPPDEIDQGGTLVTEAIAVERIGRFYRELGLTNVEQILANTANWEPDFGPIDIAFIDGCHDAEFVFNDTCKVLQRARPGTLILWHDFQPQLVDQFSWIADVCRGVDRLYTERRIRGPIFHLADSWVGLYRVDAKDLPAS